MAYTPCFSSRIQRDGICDNIIRVDVRRSTMRPPSPTHHSDIGVWRSVSLDVSNLMRPCVCVCFVFRMFFFLSYRPAACCRYAGIVVQVRTCTALTCFQGYRRDKKKKPALWRAINYLPLRICYAFWQTRYTTRFLPSSGKKPHFVRAKSWNP